MMGQQPQTSQDRTTGDRSTELFARGASAMSHGGFRLRTWDERLRAIPDAMARRDEFLARVKVAVGDVVRLSDLMAEAISMDREARSMESIGRDSRTAFTIERLASCHCMDSAREAYLKARGSNQQPGITGSD